MTISAPPSSFTIGRDGRKVQGRLDFAEGAGRTFVAAQRMPYPFHITRPFYLDRARPELATLYLQSASGGLYRADHLDLAITLAEGASAHITTQSATVVHDSQHLAVQQNTRLDLQPGSLLFYTPDPVVLFPDAGLHTAIEAILAPGARAVVTDAQTWFDPKGAKQGFWQLKTSVSVKRPEGRVLALDCSRMNGADLASAFSPMGAFGAFGSVFILGDDIAAPDLAEAQSRLDGLGCRIGLGRLPNDCGQVVRLVAPNGGLLSRGLEAVFAVAFRDLTGCAASRRRK